MEQLTARGAPMPPHYADAIAAGRVGAPGAIGALANVVADDTQPAIARATALAMLIGPASAGDETLVALLVEEAGASNALLRVVAAGGLEVVDPAKSVPVLAKLVADPVRAVRAEAARVLSGIAEPSLSTKQSDAFAAALDEFREGQQALSDTPEANLNLGVLAARRNRPGAAEKAFEAALSVQPDFIPARVNLANLLNGHGRNDEAIAHLRSAIQSHERLSRFVPETDATLAQRGELHYSLGLVFAEVGRLDESAASLSEAAERLPDRARVQYNHGLALQRLGRNDDALAALHRAEVLAPGSPDLHNALAILHFRMGNQQEAVRHAEQFVEATGGAPAARQLLERVRAGNP